MKEELKSTITETLDILKPYSVGQILTYSLFVFSLAAFIAALSLLAPW